MRNKKGGIFYMIAHYTKTSHFLDYIHPSGHFRISSFSKLKDDKWQYESEYRVTLFSKEDEYAFIPTQEGLIAVVLGADANKDDFDKINAI
jgi:hypothetical protein